jgi:hypothetical protein
VIWLTICKLRTRDLVSCGSVCCYLQPVGVDLKAMTVCLPALVSDPCCILFADPQLQSVRYYRCRLLQVRQRYVSSENLSAPVGSGSRCRAVPLVLFRTVVPRRRGWFQSCCLLTKGEAPHCWLESPGNFIKHNSFSVPVVNRRKLVAPAAIVNCQYHDRCNWLCNCRYRQIVSNVVPQTTSGKSPGHRL